MTNKGSFIFVTCQVGAEKAVKTEVALRRPDFRFAYSRPGFLTFKLPDGVRFADDFDLQSVFARAYAFSLGKIEGDNPAAMIEMAWQLLGDRPVRRIHVWQRDEREPGEHSYEPTLTPTVFDIHQKLLAALPNNKKLPAEAQAMQTPAERGDLILDCVLVAPNEWWIGYHKAHSVSSCWPGGMLALEMPSGIVSRAWLKMEEALRWSQLPIGPEARVAEIGSAPGGASQALLHRGCFVTGIDPAEMHPDVLANPHFTHIQKRSTQVRRKEFRKIRWLTADMNVAPKYTLEAAESIVTHPEVSIRGMLLTLKFPDWKFAADVPKYISLVRSWGFNQVQARQLQYNRREICLAALQKPFVRKS